MITWRPILLFGFGLLTLPMWPNPWLGMLLWLAAVGVACGVDAALAANPADVTMWRTGDTMARLGGTATVTLHVRNDGERPLHGVVRDAWTPSAGAHQDRFHIALPPAATTDLTSAFTPTRRGDRPAVRVTVRSQGPFGFACRHTTHRTAKQATPPWRIRVTPPFHARRHLPEKLAKLRVIEGVAAARGRGQGTEFDALREYVPGDDVRSIEWRSSMRRQTIVVKTWRAERDRRVLSVIDTGRTSAARVGDEPRLDAQIEASLLLSAVASHAGDRVHALAVDTEVRAAVDSGSQTSVVPRITRALAPLQSSLVETDFGLVVREALRRESKRALVVLFTSLEPGPITESLLPVLPQLASRHRCIVAAVSDPEAEALRRARGSQLDLYRAAAAEQAYLERRKVVAALARYGVDVVEAPADRFAPEVVDTYLALKAAGRL